MDVGRAGGAMAVGPRHPALRPWDDDAFICRFRQLVDERSASECWQWKGANIRGRGCLSYKGRRFLAPRIARIIVDRAWPQAGLCACHSCDNPRCVNPAHIWWGTVAENNQDARAKGRHGSPFSKSGAHCRNGHEFKPETYRTDNRGTRVCKICAAERQRRWRDKSFASRPFGFQSLLRRV